MKKETRGVYVTSDGKEFLSENQAKNHEESMNYTEWFLVHFDPDLNETGNLRERGYLKITAYHSHDKWAKHYMYENFGSSVAFIQGAAPCDKWTISRGSKKDPESQSIIGVINKI